MNVSGMSVAMLALGLVAMVGHSIWHGASFGHHGELDHRALEKRRSSIRGVPSLHDGRKIQMLQTQTSVQGIDLDIEIKKDPAKSEYGMKLNVARSGSGKAGKPGKMGDAVIKAIERLNLKSLETTFMPEVERKYIFPRGRNVDADHFNPVYLLEVFLDIKSDHEYVDFVLYEKDSLKPFCRRKAVEQKQKVVYAIPLPEGAYFGRITDFEGNLLGRGKDGTLEVIVNHNKIVDDEELPAKDAPESFELTSDGSLTEAMVHRI